MVPTVYLERENSLTSFRLLILPMLNLRDVNNSSDIHGIELKKVKGCVCDTCTSSLSSFVGQRKTGAHSLLEYKGRRLSDNRSFVDPAIVTLSDGLKMTITEWSLLIRFFFEVVLPGDRGAHLSAA
ncbi:hypothetical protein AVEN_172499-1 [Araneus ventricosus]|uniref:Uncharacterized protein n=1 Tax=Araneus ventricosus TaxID=182803 RepID=A0A4Y2DSA1_ARAVE|nr:hypothetical protein AVEN_172499-1 [Araneus ventricosus]